MSSGREPPPPALLEPYVTVSRHTAPTVRRWVGNDFNLCFGLPLGSSPEGLTSRRPWTARPLRSDPITGPSSLLRAGPPLCPASVLSHSRCSSLVVLPLAASKAGPSYQGDRFSCYTSACDELTPPIHRTPPGPHTGRSPAEDPPRRASLCPGTTHRPRFRCRRLSFRCVSSGSHMFVFSSHTKPR